MNEQEERIEAALMSLGNVMIDIRPRKDNCDKKEYISEAFSAHSGICLRLIEEDSLDLWEVAIKQAIVIEAKVIEKRKWEETNPVFIERIKAKLKNRHGY